MEQEHEKEIFKNVSIWDFVNPLSPRCSEEVAQDRFDICKSCNDFLPKTERCKHCKCFMKAKTTLLDAVCPIGKW